MANLKNKCAIFIRFGGKKAKLPVNPEEIEIRNPTNHKTFDVLGLGQIVVPRKPALRTVVWDGFFPGDLSASYVNSGAKSPKYYVSCFEKALKKKQVCRLIISRSGLCDTNMSCIVSDFKTKDKGGEPDDIYYSVELQEYRPYEPDTLTITIPAPNISLGTGGAEGEPAADACLEVSRPVEVPVLRVGASVIVNGEYCYDSFGSRPHKTANNIATTVTRIETSGNPYPIHVGSYGWVQENQLQIMG